MRDGMGWFVAVSAHWRIGCGVGLILLSHAAWASYVNDCRLTGTVLQPAATRTAYVDDGQGEHEISSLDVLLKVHSAKPNGRADSGCAHYVGQTLSVHISPVPRVMLLRGQRIRVDVSMTNSKGMPDTRTEYELVWP